MKKPAEPIPCLARPPPGVPSAAVIPGRERGWGGDVRAPTEGGWGGGCQPGGAWEGVVHARRARRKGGWG